MVFAGRLPLCCPCGPFFLESLTHSLLRPQRNKLGRINRHVWKAVNQTWVKTRVGQTHVCCQFRFEFVIVHTWLRARSDVCLACAADRGNKFLHATEPCGVHG